MSKGVTVENYTLCKLLIAPNTGKFVRAETFRPWYGRCRIECQNNTSITFVGNDSNNKLTYLKHPENFFETTLELKQFLDWNRTQVQFDDLSINEVYNMLIKDFHEMIKDGVDVRCPIQGKWSFRKWNGTGMLVYRKDLE